MSTSGGSFYIKFGKVFPGSPSAGYFAENPNTSSTSEFTFSSKMSQASVQTGSITAEDLSYETFTLFDYSSSALDPPALSGFDGWYGYLKKLAEVNVFDENVQSFSTPSQPASTLAGDLSSYFPPGANPNVYTINGNVTLQAGAVCNTKALVYIEGDFTIEPNLTIQDKTVVLDGPDVTGQACLFVVNGNTTIKPGGAGGATEGGTFDLLEIGLISQGKTLIEYDGNDALKIDGFIGGRYGDFQRHTADQDKPSVWINYDPRYMQIFKEELKINRFSTKEKGFVASNF
jgi:hypothetical protein